LSRDEPIRIILTSRDSRVISQRRSDMYSGGPYLHSEYAHRRQRELIEEAERYRLISQALQDQENARVQRYRFYQKALVKLGEQLVTNLQGRYIRESETPKLAAYQEGRLIEGK
jgi:hypothetical protein